MAPLPDAPAWFYTPTCRPSCRASPSAAMRPRISVSPPGEVSTTIRIARFGYALCADTNAVKRPRRIPAAILSVLTSLLIPFENRHRDQLALDFPAVARDLRDRFGALDDLRVVHHSAEHHYALPARDLDPHASDACRAFLHVDLGARRRELAQRIGDVRGDSVVVGVRSQRRRRRVLHRLRGRSLRLQSRLEPGSSDHVVHRRHDLVARQTPEPPPPPHPPVCLAPERDLVKAER